MGVVSPYIRQSYIQHPKWHAMYLSRRDCLLGLAAAGCALPLRAAGGEAADKERRLILVIFGAGVRNSETIDDKRGPLGAAAPQGTDPARHALDEHARRAAGGPPQLQRDDQDRASRVRRPRLGTSAASIRRSSRSSARPRKLPDTAAWSFVYASILAKTGESTAEGYGPAYAANVVEPPTIPRATAERMDRLMAEAAASGSPEAEAKAAAAVRALARGARPM